MIIQFTDSTNKTYFIHTDKIQFIEIAENKDIDVHFSNYIVRLGAKDNAKFLQLYKRAIDKQIITEAK